LSDALSLFVGCRAALHAILWRLTWLCLLFEAYAHGADICICVQINAFFDTACFASGNYLIFQYWMSVVQRVCKCCIVALFG
tara:strand:- start:112 stop:357 length:246 start_codon:yes stop_codon:yes gene_type:complete